MLPNKPASYVWHPAYPAVPAARARAGVRGELGIPAGAKLYGFLGLLRPYKGVEYLIEAFRHIDRDAWLLIAGKPQEPEYADQVSKLVAGLARVVFIARELTDAQFAGFLRAIDVAVLPFRDSLHSGSMVHALSEGFPVLKPEAPFADALAAAAGPGCVNTYRGVLDGASLISAGRPTAVPAL